MVMRFAIRVFWTLIMAILSCLVCGEVAAERIAIAPADSEIGFRAYGFGVIPLHGRFTRFEGWLDFSATGCSVALLVDVSSLTMDPALARDIVLGPDFMDAAQHPAMRFAGICNGNNLDGNLTLHGVTRLFRLTIGRGEQRAVAQGSLRRADWGMTGKPLLAGPAARIEVSVPIPAFGTSARVP
jgi:polyisoprenoid-binding protein YceI